MTDLHHRLAAKMRQFTNDDGLAAMMASAAISEAVEECKSIAAIARRDPSVHLGDEMTDPIAGDGRDYLRVEGDAGMNFNDFSIINRRRCEASNGFNHRLVDWSLSDWFTATVGELGEAANIAKKLNRVRDGIPGNSDTPEQLKQMFADEIADTFIYLDLLAQSQGIVLQDAVLNKFARTSKKLGYKEEQS